jgi:hypothetical protein
MFPAFFDEEDKNWSLSKIDELGISRGCSISSFFGPFPFSLLIV